MAFNFPATTVKPKTAKWRLLSAASEPPTGSGGADQRFLALGSRYVLDVVYPPMTKADAGAIIGALLRAEREEVVYPILQPGLKVPPTYGRTITAPSSANATVLAIGAAPAGVVEPLQMFNVIGGDGRKYLHAFTEGGNIPGNLRVAPAIRIPVDAGYVIDVAAPVIQGFVQGRETGWDVNEARHYGVAFSIKERK